MLRSVPVPAPAWLCSRCTGAQPRPAPRLRVVAALPPDSEGDTPLLHDGVGARKPRGPLSAETKQRQSASAKRRDHTPAARALLAAANAGKKKAFAERPKARGSLRSVEVCPPVVVSAAGGFVQQWALSGLTGHMCASLLHHTDATVDV